MDTIADLALTKLMTMFPSAKLILRMDGGNTSVICRGDVWKVMDTGERIMVLGIDDDGELDLIRRYMMLPDGMPTPDWMRLPHAH